MKRIAGHFFVFCIYLSTNSLFGISENYFKEFSAFSTDFVRQIEIIGRVIDKETGEAIPFCNISIASSPIGTSSNEMGEFIIHVESLPVKLVFSHVNYGSFIVEVFQIPYVIIELTPLTNQLDEVIVIASNKDAFALELAKKAFQKADNEKTRSKYGRAFYRQKSKNGDKYSEFSEIIYDIRYNSKGIEDWDILEGRYALKPGGVHNKNFTLLSRLFTPFQPDTDEIIFPMHPGLEVFYDVHIIEYIQSSDATIAVLGFKPKKSDKTPIFEAEIYINTKTYNILKITGNILRDDLKFVQLTEKNSFWKNYSVSFEIAYNLGTDNDSAIDYINVAQEFDYYKNDSLKFHSASTSNLTFFEHYAPTSRKKLGGQFKKNKSDWQNLDDIGYNEKFWEENHIVKRTPVEEEVIASFEKTGSFGSIFLNSRDQVTFLQSDLMGDPFVKELEISVNLYNNYNPIEKVYLHTDKELFASGETIWYSGYTVLGPYHYFSTASRVLHVDLIGPKNEILLSQTQEIVKGKTLGSIELPEKLPSGNYQLRSYTNWMRNFDSDFFFTKTIEILNVNNPPILSSKNIEKIDLQFFPEGGQSVANLVGQVAFKAIGNDGLERNIKGRIVDSKGKFVNTLGTIDRGAGFFTLKPLAGENYRAILSDGSEYSLPKIMDQGYTMTINNTSPKSVQVKIQATDPLMTQPFYIVGHLNNRKYFQGKFEFRGNPVVDFEIPKSKTPSGVMVITLFDAQKKPWCERLVFVNNQEELVITTNMSPKKISKRNEVSLDVHVMDTDGRPVSAELSMTVTDAGQILKDPNSANILTHLLLQSDIKGHVTDPGLLFKDQRRTTLYSLDLVMLTHGWRKFPWQDIKSGSKTKKEFNFSKGLSITGTARSLKGIPMPNTVMNVIAKSGENMGIFSARTLSTGRFSLDSLNFMGSTAVVFSASDGKNRPISVEITLDNRKGVLPPPQFKSLEVKENKINELYTDFAGVRKKFDSIYTFRNITELDEVVVIDKKTDKKRNSSNSTYGQTSDATLYTSDHLGLQTILQLVSLFPGVSVNGNLVSIRQRGTPLWVLNGIPVYNESPSASGLALARQEAERNPENPRPQLSLQIEESIAAGPVPSFISTMDTFAVERVEILKGPSAAIYGSRGANGVILIYTKKGGEETIKNISAPDFTIMGHAAERRFYSPKYNFKLDEHNAPDYRATLYWNPSFTTDENGNATIKFFNSDNAQQIQVAIEGLSAFGIPGAYLQTIGQ